MISEPMTNPNETTDLADVWSEIVRIATVRGQSPISKLDGCFQIGNPDKGWFVAVNGGKEPRKAGLNDKIQPTEAYVQWNGWPAGGFNWMEGWIAAGDVANLASLLEWLKTQAIEGAT